MGPEIWKESEFWNGKMSAWVFKWEPSVWGYSLSFGVRWKKKNVFCNTQIPETCKTQDTEALENMFSVTPASNNVKLAI